MESQESREENRTPPYTVQQYRDLFLDYYTFLTKLHISPSQLKIPPPEGWNFPREFIGDKLTDLAYETMCHLPYLSPHNLPVDYKSELIDWTVALKSEFNDIIDYTRSNTEFWGEENELDENHFLPISVGHESGGVTLLLCPLNGGLYQDIVRMDGPHFMNIEQRFGEYKEMFKNLDMIPFPGKTLLDVCGKRYKPCRSRGPITEEEVLAQDPKEWIPTVLDTRYLKQVYRGYGWPLEFRREECFEYVEGLLKKMEERERGGWEDDRTEYGVMDLDNIGGSEA
ncbi:hypothetical protein QBC38DRAFT_374402 [Podospora fimiseda]|uniref:Uncharacterized protein n=1 Tax=Podospora fimiseda TaxID=252190 RepID=A0AAN6YRU6_9PEZI|nr:hypothetical protein QBC38DRAFT_374402 [Podospora fimiseda]